MLPTYREKLETAHAERAEILDRLRGLYDAMKLDAPPTLSPFTSETAAASLGDAIRTFQGSGDTTALASALTAAEAPEGMDYGDDTTPVVALSLAGLRRFEAVVSELQQRRQREAEGAGV